MAMHYCVQLVIVSGHTIDSIPYGHGIRNDHRLCSYHPCPDHKAIQTVVTREVYVHTQMASVTPQNTDGAAGLKNRNRVW